VNNGPAVRVVELTVPGVSAAPREGSARQREARGAARVQPTSGTSTLSRAKLSGCLLTSRDVPYGYVPDLGASSTIAMFIGGRATDVTQTLVEAHFARRGANQILEENIRSYRSKDDAAASFQEACRAAQAFIAFTRGDNPAISVTSMPVPNFADETFALRMATADSLAAAATHVRVGRLQVTVLMAGGVVDERLLVTTTHNAVRNARCVRQ
jgi:hypothetical protein